MGGSRKGERRGGKRKSTVVVPDGPRGRPKNRKNREKIVNALGVPIPKRIAPKATEQYYRDVQRVIGDSPDTAAALIEPREVMLETMRYFHGRSREGLKYLNHIISTMPDQPSAEAAREIDAQIGIAEAQIKENALTASDVAFKVAPYVHPRLSSTEIAGDSANPVQIVGILLKEIDMASRGRPTWAPPTLELSANKEEEETE